MAMLKVERMIKKFIQSQRKVIFMFCTSNMVAVKYPLYCKKVEKFLTNEMSFYSVTWEDFTCNSGKMQYLNGFRPVQSKRNDMLRICNGTTFCPIWK